MTVSEIIAKVRALRSSTFSDEQIVDWLNEVDGYVQTEVLLWPIIKTYRYAISGTAQSAGAWFRDSSHITLQTPAYFAPGGTVTIAGLETYADNNGGPWELIDRSDDGLVLEFQPGTFSVLGDEPDSGTATLAYNGTGAELLVLPPHDKLYVPYILAQMAFAQEEWDGYENYKAMYNEYLGEYKRWFGMKYRPADTWRR